MARSVFLALLSCFRLQGRGGQEKVHVWFVRYDSTCLWLIDTVAP
jgi:hypothetical protein